jgi:L-ascorbate metabolism protein UlaG (beta-lactamase superfamily)
MKNIKQHTVLVALAICFYSNLSFSSNSNESYENSLQYKDGHFYNSIKSKYTEDIKSVFSIAWQYLTDKTTGQIPSSEIPIIPVTEEILNNLPDNEIHIIRLGHSSHIIKLNGKIVLLDPMFSNRASPFTWVGPKRFHKPPISLEQMPSIDYIIISHDHYDHLDETTIKSLDKKTMRYFVPLGVKKHLLNMGVAKQKITEMDWWDEQNIDDAVLISTPAHHFSGRTLLDRKKTLWTSWVISAPNGTIFFSGDSGYFEGFKKIGAKFKNIDIALIEDGAYNSYWPGVHMTPDEGMQAFLDLKAKVLFPIHNSTFNLALHSWKEPLERIHKLSIEKNVILATPRIGEILTLGKERKNELWWESL